MNRLSSALMFLLGGCILSLALSCTKEVLSNEQTDNHGNVHIDFFIGKDDNNGSLTKITQITESNESKINRWALFLFDAETGGIRYSGSNNSAAEISTVINAGTYDAYAVVNYPTSGSRALNPSSITSKSAFNSVLSYLADNSTSSLMMFGSEQFTFHEGDNGSKGIEVKRLVAKLGIRKISVNMTRPSDAERTFVLKGIYATNVSSRCPYAADYTSSQQSSAQSAKNLWYNAMGWGTSGSCTSPASPTSFLGDRNLDVTIENNGSHDTSHYFYVYPNAISSDSTSSSSWSARHTRMVIEATIDGVTVYYRVDLPVIYRNNTYIADEAIIHRPGSLNPEEDIPGALDISFTVGVSGWDSEVSINETS